MCPGPSPQMVNVNARLPINLHHENFSSITDTMDRHPPTSSNSHSVSTSTSNRSRGLVPLSSTPHLHAQIQAHVGGPLTVFPSNTSLVDLVTNPHATGIAWLLEAPVSTHGHDLETSKGAALRSPVIHAHLARRPGLGIARSEGAAAAARRGETKDKETWKRRGSQQPDRCQTIEFAIRTTATTRIVDFIYEHGDDRTLRLQYSAASIIGGITDVVNIIHPPSMRTPTSLDSTVWAHVVKW